MDSYSRSPESVSYEDLLEVLFDRTLVNKEDDELIYFLDLVQRLRDLKERTDTEAWWFDYYR